MVKSRRTGTTYRITSLPRRLFYKTKRVIMTPVRKARAHHHTTTAAPTAAPTTTNTHRRHPKLFGGFKRGRTRQTPPAHKTKAHRFFGYAIRKNPNRNHNNHHRNHRTIKAKLRSLLH